MNYWTEQSKQEAIKLIKQELDLSKQRVDLQKIADIVKMSYHSVKLVYYNDVLGYNERIKCELCREQFRQITQKHLRLYHNIDLDKYKAMFPNAKTATNRRIEKYKTFKHPNKGKTYQEIYGEKEALRKRNKISQKQIGRPAHKLAGTGIAGTRKDTNTFARSTYEANIDRIFILEGKKYLDEFSELNKRVTLLTENGNKVTYQPDRVDVDGLFSKGAYLEIKGYMYPEDWEKIKLFRAQYVDRKLLIISSDEKYFDINYDELENKYKSKISLWEDGHQNYKTRADLYVVGYQFPEKIKYLNDNYPNRINKEITNLHQKFIANRCMSFNRVSLGKQVYIDKINLIAITNKRKGASRLSSGDYNFELWEVKTLDNELFYVTNQTKTSIFYCYAQDRLSNLREFFNENCDMSITCGSKKNKAHEFIDENLWLRSDEDTRRILQIINNSLRHRGVKDCVEEVFIKEKRASKHGCFHNYEAWSVCVSKGETKYILSNFGHPTRDYTLYDTKTFLNKFSDKLT